MCDCNVAQAFAESWRSARKRHRCCECAGWIEPKERYEYASGIWDNQAYSYKTCKQCVQVRDWVGSHLDRSDCAPCFGGLYDDVPRADWPGHMVMAQSTLARERRVA